MSKPSALEQSIPELRSISLDIGDRITVIQDGSDPNWWLVYFDEILIGWLHDVIYVDHDPPPQYFRAYRRSSDDPDGRWVAKERKMEDAVQALVEAVLTVDAAFETVEAQVRRSN